jgi:2,5-diamino-6-(ribosylamino)-4(3H)-pyrimidinone 5'-phosphate reductase
VTTLRDPPAKKKALLEKYGGRFIILHIATSDIAQLGPIGVTYLSHSGRMCLHSVMIEGGGQVINSLLAPPYLPLIYMVIAIIAPTWLGQGGAVVSPARRFDEDKPISAARLTKVKWYPFGEDVVLCGQVKL